jgi:hypothetical protein
MKSLVAPYRLLAKIILANLWSITRCTKLIIEKAQFMYAIAINVPIDHATYFINVIQKALSNKKSSFPFGGLITKIVILAKVSLKNVKPMVKMSGKIFIVTVVKSEVVVNKKRHLN